MMKLSGYALLFFLAGLGTLLVSSCHKEENVNSFCGETVALRVSVSGINDCNEKVVADGGNRSDYAISSCLQSVTVPAGNSLLLKATLEQSPVATRGTTPLTTGVRYRVIAFKQGNVSAAGYLSHADFAVGTAEPIAGYLHVLPGATYTFVCYSMNGTTLPVFDKTALDITTNPAEGDLLYAKFDQAITVTGNALVFGFTPKFSQITVIADATSMAQDITAISAEISPNYSATLTLASGALTALGDAGSRVISWGTVTPGQTVAAKACTVFTNGNSGIRITIPSVTIGGTTQVDLKAFFGSNTMQTGGKYTLRLKLIKASGNSEGIVLNGLTWAPGNLNAVPNGDGTFLYYFAPAQESYSGLVNGGDYFCWDTLDPTVNASSNATGVYDASTDPCTKVIPEGTWRMPTKEEFEALVASGFVAGNKNEKHGVYLGTTTIPPVLEEWEEQFVFLPAAGYGWNLEPIANQNESCCYWTWTSGGENAPYVMVHGSFPHYENYNTDEVSVFATYSQLTDLPVRCVK